MSYIAWKEVNWPTVESRILRYQTRIFKASRDKNIARVKCLQKRLLRSLDAKLLSVRQVTTLNKDKKIPVIDKSVVLTDLQKGKLVKKLRLNTEALLVGRVYRDQPGKKQKVLLPPVDISIVEDRAKQTLCKLALEPQWEAYFEANSYGYRTGRYYQDAVEAIFLSLRENRKDQSYQKYVLDIEIEKRFNQINYDYLIKKLRTLPEIRRQIKSWLMAGILEKFLDTRKKMNIFESIISPSQEEIISPLLVNIAFHGLENHMKKWIDTKRSLTKTNRYTKYVKQESLILVRYLDNLILIHKNENVIREAKQEITKWIWDGPHLKLNEEKTIIRNTNNGFHFLGFTFITINKSNILKIKIYPSRKSQTFLLLKVRRIIQNNRSASAYNLINLIYPIIIRWANYYKYSECSKVFIKVTHLISQMLRAWVFRRDTRNGRKFVKQHYFPSKKNYIFRGTKYSGNWVLNGKQLEKNNVCKKNWLPHIAWIKREKWVKITGAKSPFAINSMYWKKRTQTKSN